MGRSGPTPRPRDPTIPTSGLARRGHRRNAHLVTCCCPADWSNAQTDLSDAASATCSGKGTGGIVGVSLQQALAGGFSEGATPRLANIGPRGKSHEPDAFTLDWPALSGHDVACARPGFLALLPNDSCPTHPCAAFCSCLLCCGTGLLHSFHRRGHTEAGSGPCHPLRAGVRCVHRFCLGFRPMARPAPSRSSCLIPAPSSNDAPAPDATLPATFATPPCHARDLGRRDLGLDSLSSDGRVRVNDRPI